MHPTFKGGAHLPGMKHLTADAEFKNLPIPQYCYISMQQHTGAPARPVVKAGATVEEGQVIGVADGPLGANVHASVPGKVVDIIDMPGVKKKQR